MRAKKEKFELFISVKRTNNRPNDLLNRGAEESVQGKVLPGATERADASFSFASSVSRGPTVMPQKNVGVYHSGRKHLADLLSGLDPAHEEGSSEVLMFWATPEVSSPTVHEGLTRIDGRNRGSVVSAEEKGGFHLVVEGLLEILQSRFFRFPIAPVVPPHGLICEGLEKGARADVPMAREVLERTEEVENRRSWKDRYPYIEPLEGATVVPPSVRTER